MQRGMLFSGFEDDLGLWTGERAQDQCPGTGLADSPAAGAPRATSRQPPRAVGKASAASPVV